VTARRSHPDSPGWAGAGRAPPKANPTPGKEPAPPDANAVAATDPVADADAVAARDAVADADADAEAVAEAPTEAAADADAAAATTPSYAASDLVPPDNLTETSFDTPGSSIVTPYSVSTVSMVRLLWVMRMNWDALAISFTSSL
jgi:hypothetical protein